MSRNGHFALHGSLATAYAPNAERSAEGDILGVSAYDLAGLREDDAAMRLGVSAYDLAGLREDDAAMRLGVSAYDLSGLREDDADMRLGGLREDDASVRLGVSAYDLGDTNFDGATGSAEGSAEGHAVAQMGILVSDGRVGGMREDHYDVRMGVSAYDLSGLREDDAVVRLGARRGHYGTRYGASYGSEYKNPQYGTEYTSLPGRRTRRRVRKMGTAYIEDAAGSAEDPRGRAGMGDVDDMGAEAWAIEQHGRIGALTQNFRMGYILRGLREDDAEVRMGVSAYDLSGLREDDASVRMGVSAYDLGVSAYDLGRRRAFSYGVSGAEKYPPAMLAAEGFHERFPVNVEIRGLGRIRMGYTWDEAVTKLQVAISQEQELMARINRLPADKKAAVLSQVQILNSQSKSQLFNGELSTYLSEGSPGWAAHSGRTVRLADTEKLIPTVNTLVTQMEQGATPSQAVNAAIKDVNQKLADLGKPSFMSYALPIGAGAAGAAALTALVLALAK